MPFCVIILIVILFANNAYTLQDLKIINNTSSIKNNIFQFNESHIKIDLKVKGSKNTSIGKDFNKNTRLYTQDNLTDNNYFTIYNALEKTPGVTVGKSFKDVIDIRGQGEDARRRVQVLFDDIPLNLLDNTHYFPGFNIFQSQVIEKVEIIPGGGSVVYGNGTQGGVVNILTNFRDMHSTPNNQIYQGFASFNTKRFGTSLGNYIFNNKLFIQLDYNRVEDEAYQKKEWAKKEYISCFTKLNITENQIIGYSYSNYRVDGVYTNNVQKSKLMKDWRAHGQLYRHDRKEDFHKLSFQGQYFNCITIDNLAFNHKHEFSQDNISSKTDTKNGCFPQSVKGNKLKAKLIYGNKEQNFLLLGNDIIHTRFKLIPRSKPLWSCDKDTFALFALNKIYLENFYLLTGYRYNLDQWTKKYPEKDNQKPNAVKYIHVNSNQNYDACHVSLGIDFTKNHSLWVGLETGFTAPESLDFTNKINGKYVPNNNIKYETFKTLELGMEHKISAIGTYFRTVIFNTYTKNEISRPYIGKVDTYSLNIGNTSRNGIEINTEQYLFDDIVSLSFGVTAINSKYRAINYNALKQYVKDIKQHSTKPPKDIEIDVEKLINKLENRKGKTIKKVPPVTLNARINIKILKPLTFSTNFHYYSSYMASLENTFNGTDKVSDKLITDLSVSYKVKNLFISIGVNNITNQKYFISDSHGGSKNGIGTARPAMLRNYFFDMKYKFNWL